MILKSRLRIDELPEISVLMKTLIRKFIGLFGFVLIKKKTLATLTSGVAIRAGLDFLIALQSHNTKVLLPILGDYKSQNFQDLFVLSELNLKKSGFFVEFGATNGIHESNSFLLENSFGWRGILAEPAKTWHKELHRNRPLASIEDTCVWKESNLLLSFNETEDGNLSTLDFFSGLDSHREFRKHGRKYEVTTISLTDLLDKYSAPRSIDYLSIDSEGSEFEILNAFDFEKYSFSVITCEHNYTSAREKICELLTSKGYIRKYEELSLWDDWYVKA